MRAIGTMLLAVLAGPQAFAADHLTLRLCLRTVEAAAVPGSPPATVDITGFPDGGRIIVEGPAVAEPNNSGCYQAKVRRAGKGDVARKLEGSLWRISIAVPGFRQKLVGPVRLAERGAAIVPADSAEPIKALLFRDHKHWQPEFDCLRQITGAPELELLRQILDANANLKMPVHLLVPKLNWWKKLLPVPSFNAEGFNSPVIETHPRPLDRARATLLNIFHVLSSNPDAGCRDGAGINWLGWIQRIDVIGAERFIAKVDRTMFDTAKRLASLYEDYSCANTVEASAALHGLGNPRSTHWRNGKMQKPERVVSIKTPVCQGNVQITVGQFGKDETLETFADFDIDESFGSSRHAGDVVKHHATGKGTNAYRIGEMLAVREMNRLLEKKNAMVGELNLGYRLIPLGLRPQGCAQPGRTLLRAY